MEKDVFFTLSALDTSEYSRRLSGSCSSAGDDLLLVVALLVLSIVEESGWAGHLKANFVHDDSSIRR